MQTFEKHKSTTALNAKQEQPFFASTLLERQATGNNFSNTGSSPFFQARPQPVVQTKLQVNTPGDAYEQQADAVADQVMRMRTGDAPIVQRMPLTPLNGVQRMCSECAAGHEEEKAVQRKDSGGAGGHSAPPIVSQVLASGGGQAMDSSTRQFMESRFGQDFSAVRIHTDSRAAESASAIQARAYTSGNNVVFGAGEYQPGSEGGKRLLAHELVHVGQQGGLPQQKIQRSNSFLFGGQCCNFSTDGEPEWALVGEPAVWRRLDVGECTSFFGEDCDGMTCGGGFYAVSNGMKLSTCITPRRDGFIFGRRRWTPTSRASSSAVSPQSRSSGVSNTPPGYVYDTASPSP